MENVWPNGHRAMSLASQIAHSLVLTRVSTRTTTRLEQLTCLTFGLPSVEWEMLPMTNVARATSKRMRGS